MIYQFEHDEITNCGDCPCCNSLSGCRLDELEESFDKIPADCPLVAISKTETTSCEWCDKTLMLFTKSGKYIPENQPPRNYCPNCGRKLN